MGLKNGLLGDGYSMSWSYNAHSRIMGLMMIATWLSFFWRSQWLVAIYLVLTGTMEFPMTFPENIGNGKSSQLTNSYFSEGSVYRQPDNIDVIFLLEPSIMINHGWLPQTSHFSLSAEALTPNIWVVIRSAIYWQKNHQNIWGNHQKISKSSKQIIGQKIKKIMKMFPPGKSHEILVFGMRCWCQVDHNGLIEFQVEPWQPWCQKNGLIPWFTDGL